MEFALVLPLLLSLVLGIVEFGYAFYVQGAVAGAAREGARELAIHKATADPIARTMDALPDQLVPRAIATVTSDCPGTVATVSVTYDYGSGVSGLLGIVTGVSGQTVTLTGEGSMRCGG